MTESQGNAGQHISFLPPAPPIFLWCQQNSFMGDSTLRPYLILIILFTLKLNSYNTFPSLGLNLNAMRIKRLLKCLSARRAKEMADGWSPLCNLRSILKEVAIGTVRLDLSGPSHQAVG